MRLMLKRGEIMIGQRSKKKPSAYVIMPFLKTTSLNNNGTNLNKDELNTIFSMIQRVLEKVGYEVCRSESPSDILRDIILNLYRADLVIADLTSLNPNVIYELGIRHAFCKKTILITQNRSELPFDLAGHQCIEYGWATEGEKQKFQKEISQLLTLIDKHDDPRYGPVHTYLGNNDIEEYDYNQIKTIKSIERISPKYNQLNVSIIAQVYGTVLKESDPIKLCEDLKI